MTINMDIINLTLGIVGTIVGIVSLSVHLLEAKKRKPASNNKSA